MKKNYVKIVDENRLVKIVDENLLATFRIDENLLATFRIEESDIVEVLSKNVVDLGYGLDENYTVRTSDGRELILVESQFKPLGNSLRERILTAGIENCFFYGEYYDHGKFLMNIDEARYKVINNYKITLKKVEDKENYHHFYISDLDSMIERGQVMFLIKAPQK